MTTCPGQDDQLKIDTSRKYQLVDFELEEENIRTW